MKADIKVKWVEALRSGEYKQGHFELCNKDHEYCCLGVLCKVLGEKFVDEGGIVKLKNYNENSYLPLELESKVDMNFNDCSLLAYMNDQSRKNFSEIADYIQEKL